MKLSKIFTFLALFEASKAEIECTRNSNGLIKCIEGNYLQEYLNKDT